jgi:hypothetical protein
MSAENITFGHEHELVFPEGSLPPGESWDETSKHDLALRELVRYFKFNSNTPISIPCQCIPEDISEACKEAPAENHIMAEETIIRPPPGMDISEVTTADTFSLQNDILVPDEEHGWAGLEVASQMQRLSSLEQNPSPVTRLMWFMRDWGAQVAVTHSCGMHVHVGNSRRGITPDVVKKVVILVVLLEIPLLTQLVSPDRTESKYFLPLAETSHLMRTIIDGGIPSRADDATHPIFPAGLKYTRYWSTKGHLIGPFVREIWRCRDLADITQCVRNGISSLKASLVVKLRFSDVDINPEPDLKKSSIEFRYPASSFDEGYVTMWVRLSTRIMQICSEETDGGYKEVLSQVFTALEKDEHDNSPGIIPDLLHALGLSTYVSEWISIMREQNAGIDRSLIGNGEFRFLRKRT